MKLLLVSPSSQEANGGIAVWTNMFLNATKNTDIEASVLDISMIGKRLKNGSAKRSIIDEIIRTRRIFRDLRRLLKDTKFDVAHINTSCGKFGISRDYMIAKKIKKKCPNARIVVHYHCDIGHQIRSEGAVKKLKLLSSLADENIVLCKSSKDYLASLGVDSTILPNFLSSSYIIDKRESHSDRIKRAFFVGRVQRAKGVMEIFSLAERFSDIEFRLAGAISTEVSSLELPKNVTLLGPMPHDEVILEMDRADLFIFPTHSEGFSIALAESMARGLVAVATDVGANADMLGDGCGEIVALYDIDAMEAAILRLMDKGVREGISHRLIEKVKREYSEPVIIDRLIKIYCGE